MPEVKVLSHSHAVVAIHLAGIACRSHTAEPSCRHSISTPAIKHSLGIAKPRTHLALISVPPSVAIDPVDLGVRGHIAVGYPTILIASLHDLRCLACARRVHNRLGNRWTLSKEHIQLSLKRDLSDITAILRRVTKKLPIDVPESLLAVSLAVSGPLSDTDAVVALHLRFGRRIQTTFCQKNAENACRLLSGHGGTF